MNKFLIITAICLLNMAGMHAQQTTNPIYDAKRDSTLFTQVDNILQTPLTLKEKVKVNYYAYLVANHLELSKIKHTYLLNLIEIASSTNINSCKNIFLKQINFNSLSTEQELRLLKLEFAENQKKLPSDSLIVWISNQYLTEKKELREKFYLQKLDSLFKLPDLKPHPAFINAALKAQKPIIAAKLIKDINPDSAFALIKPQLDSADLLKDDPEKNRLLLLGAEVYLKLNKLKETQDLLNSLILTENDFLFNAEYHKTSTHLYLAAKQFSSASKSGQNWYNSALLIPLAEEKKNHYAQLKEFYWRAGNKKLALALNDSLNFYNSLIEKKTHGIFDKYPDSKNDEEFLRGLLEATKEFYVVKESKKDKVFPEFYHWLIEAALLSTIILLLVIRKPKANPKTTNTNIPKETIKEVVIEKVVPSTSPDNHLDNTNSLKILTEIQKNFTYNFQKTFKRSVLKINTPEGIFMGFYDLRISKITPNRGIVIFLTNNAIDNNNYHNTIRAFITLQTKIFEKGITQPSLLVKELLEHNHGSQQILVCFINNQITELTFCGKGFNLSISRNNKLHHLLTQASTNISATHDFLQDNLLELNKGDILFINLPQDQINYEIVSKFIYAITPTGPVNDYSAELEKSIIAFEV